MPLNAVKARSICHVYTEIYFVTHNRHIHRSDGEGESEERVCSQVLLIIFTDFKCNFLLFGIISQQHANLYIRAMPL